MIKYKVQYCGYGKTVWVHSSEGATVGRFDAVFGMDIHNSVADQRKNASQCLDCTYGRPGLEELERFVSYALEHWKVRVNRKKVKISTEIARKTGQKAGFYK
jgi:hypothetical protein